MSDISRHFNKKKIDLNSSGLTKFPNELKDSIKTKRLDFSGNKIRDSFEFIDTLENLEILDLRNCGLTRIPPILSRLKNLKQLIISENPLRDIAKDSALFHDDLIIYVDQSCISESFPQDDAPPGIMSQILEVESMLNSEEYDGVELLLKELCDRAEAGEEMSGSANIALYEFSLRYLNESNQKDEEQTLLKKIEVVDRYIKNSTDYDDENSAFLKIKVDALLQLKRDNEAFNIMDKVFLLDKDNEDLCAYKELEAYEEIPIRLNKMKFSPEDESAKEALNRLQKYIELSGPEVDIRPIFYEKPVSMNEVKRAEKDLGVKLPKSYVEIVTTLGLFQVGGNDMESFLMSPIVIHTATMGIQGHDMYAEVDLELSEAGIRPYDNLLCFQYSHEASLEHGEYAYAFKRDSYDEKTGEMLIVEFDMNDLYTGKAVVSFDKHVSRLVDENISSLLY